MKRLEQNIDEVLGRILHSTPQREMEAAGDRVLHRLRETRGVVAEERHPQGLSVRFGWRLAAAAAAITVVLISTFVLRSPRAFVAASGGGLFRVSAKTAHALSIGETLRVGDVFRTNGGESAVFVLPDGSRVEMRSESELSLEQAQNGFRIHLTRGDVIVNAAKQATGQHLYVQTKDVAVSVVGTVFLVNAEVEGSRVAVIEGKVEVQQGGLKSKTLLPGEQVSSSPKMAPVTVEEEISWSRNMEAHVAMLQQSTAAAAQDAKTESLRFEVVSLRAIPQSVENGSADRLFRCRGIDGIFHATTGALLNLAAIANEMAALPPSSSVPLGRCVGQAHPRQLVAQAYKIPIPTRQIVNDSGWPDIYQIEAKAPNPATVTQDQLRRMLQSLLVERYAFRMRREIRDGVGCVLRVGSGGSKLTPTSDAEEIMQTPGIVAEQGHGVFKGKFRLASFANSLWMFAGGVPVVDQTGLTGIYDITFTYELGGAAAATGAGGGAGRGGGPGSGTPCDRFLSDSLEKQLGLVLQRATVPVEYLLVDHIEKPSSN